jgi:AraC-like DNA-binding protein
MSQRNLQTDFFGRMADPLALRAMFDHLSDVFFFAKDRDSRLMAASRPILARLGVTSEADVIGTRDDQFFPPAIAAAFREDDEFVFHTGTTLTDRLEVWYDEERNFDWFLTTKVPLRDASGHVFGLMGVTRRAEGVTARPVPTEVAAAVEYFEQNSNRILTTAEVAEVCGVSERTLHRKVVEAMGTTPYELMLQIRIRKAAEALIQSPASILDIARSHGFCDQSTFTQHFRKRTGMTPKQFRRRHQ